MLMFLLLGTQWVLSHALSVNIRQKQRTKLRDSAKAHPHVAESSSGQGGGWRKGGGEKVVKEMYHVLLVRLYNTLDLPHSVTMTL